MEKKRNAYIVLTEHGQQTGLSHIQNHQPSQDVVLNYTNSTVSILGLADGQSSKKMSAVGGQVVLEHVAAFIDRVGMDSIMSYRYKDELVYDIMRVIRECLQEKAETSNIDIDDLSSTLVLIAIDKTSGRFVTMHLGDGIILGVHNESIICISLPDNGVTSQYTWLTTSQGALNHLRINYGDIADYDRIILVSDGAYDICHGKRIQQRARHLLLSAKQNDIIEYMLRSQHEDDATIIISDICRPSSLD